MELSSCCRRSACSVGLVMALLVTAAGCSSDQVQVTGKVTLPDGTPASDVSVNFDSPTLHLSARGVTNQAGEYTLSTENPNDGAKPGNYQVTVIQINNQDSSLGEPPRRFPKRYENPQESKLTFDVKAPGPNRFDIKLEPK